MYNNSKILSVIPARGRSKGIPLKNIAIVKGKPLLHYALSAVLKSKHVDRVIVSSDHPQILAIAGEYGKNVALIRPEHLALDSTGCHPVMLHALKICEEEDNCIYDYAILIHVTNPLVLPDDIDSTIEKLVDTGAESCVTVVSMGALHTKKFKYLRGDRLFPYFQEEGDPVLRQEVKEMYMRNCSCYAMTRDILSQGSLLGDDVRAIVVPKERYVDINEPFDLKMASLLLSLQERD